MHLGAKIPKLSEIAISPLSKEKDRVVYPTLYVQDIKGMDKLPDGVFSFTGKGRVATMKHNKKDGTSTCEIEVIDFTPTSNQKGSSEGLADALSKNKEELAEMEEMEEEIDEQDEVDEEEDAVDEEETVKPTTKKTYDWNQMV